jgi:glycosyltransferase involved in cell wall biosynthesis
MRLIQVLHGWPPDQMGGTGSYVQALSQALIQAGHEVMHVSPGRWRRGGLDPVEASGLRGWHIAQRPAWSWSDGWQRKPGLAVWSRILAQEAPDLVHVHHLSGLPLGLVRATQEAGIPVVLTLHDYWIPCHRGQLMTDKLRPCDGPSPLGCARCAAGEDAPSARRQRQAAERIAAAKDALLAANRIWSPSEDLARRVAAMGFRRPEHCPLPLVRPMGPPTAPGEGPVRFLFASSLIPTKGPDLLLRAFAQLQGSASLSLAGHAPNYDGRPDYAQEVIAAAAKDERVRWLGLVPAAQMAALFADHDVLVLPSIWPENSPLVVREATAAGLRIIGPSHGGTRELAPDARLVDPGDTIALLAALEAERDRGRGRAKMQPWQTPQEHALWLLQRYPSQDESLNGD